MSIKRISRRRVAAPIMDEISVNTNASVKPDDTRTGGNVETKSNVPAQSRVSGDLQSRLGTDVETRTGTNVDGRHSPK